VPGETPIGRRFDRHSSANWHGSELGWDNNIKNEVIHVSDSMAALDYLFGTGSYAGRGTGSLPSLILLDLKLPKMDELEVLQKIRENEQTRLLSVVILTTSSEEKDIVNGDKLGARTVAFASRLSSLNLSKLCERSDDTGWC
jgi:CheY-like chemotaxis protein